jgi:hypothetical protein
MLANRTFPRLALSHELFILDVTLDAMNVKGPGAPLAEQQLPSLLADLAEVIVGM